MIKDISWYKSMSAQIDAEIRPVKEYLAHLPLISTFIITRTGMNKIVIGISDSERDYIHFSEQINKEISESLLIAKDELGELYSQAKKYPL